MLVQIVPDQHSLKNTTFFCLFVEFRWRALLIVVMLWMGLSQVSVQGLQVQGSHTLKIPNSVQRLNYGTVFKSGKGLVLSNEYWRQTYEIVLPKVSSKVNLSSECMNLLTKDCILFTKVIDQIKDVELKTYLEFKHISEFLAINVPFIPLSNRVKKSLLPL